MTTYPDDADGQALSSIAAEGIDMSQPLLIEFPVAVPDEATAESVFKEMTNAGYTTQIDFDEGEPDFNPEVDDADEFGPAWTVFTTIEMVPAYDEIMRIQAELDRIAVPLGGKSDGWGALLEDELDGEGDEE